jgi:hypothetical protein
MTRDDYNKDKGDIYLSILLCLPDDTQIHVVNLSIDDSLIMTTSSTAIFAMLTSNV